MARREKALNAALGGIKQRLHGRRHAHMTDQQRKIPQPRLPRLPYRHRGGGCGGFEAHGKKHHFAVRMISGHLERIQGRIQRTHIAALGPRQQQVAARSRHPQHVTERAENGLGPMGNLDGLVDIFQRRDADRTAGSVNQFDPLRQQAVDTVFEDAMGLAAADLHERPGPGATPGNRLGQ